MSYKRYCLKKLLKNTLSLIKLLSDSVSDCSYNIKTEVSPSRIHSLNQLAINTNDDFGFIPSYFEYDHSFNYENFRYIQTAIIDFFNESRSTIENCFDNSDILLKLVDFDTVKNLNIDKSIYDQLVFNSNKSFNRFEMANELDSDAIIFEGFIMEGKSETIKTYCDNDSELDLIYRSKVDGEYIGNEYFKIFSLLGILNCMIDCVNNNKAFVIDRSWMSHQYFGFCTDKIIVKEVDEKLYCAIINLYKCYYEAKKLSSGERKYIFFPKTTKTKLRSSVALMMNISMFDEFMDFSFRRIPWPFSQYRQMEKEIYKDINELKRSYISCYSFLWISIKNYLKNDYIMID